MTEAVALWEAPQFEDSVELVENEIGPVLAGIVVIGVVSLAGLGYGAYCTSRGGNFRFKMGIKTGVELSCTR